MAQLSSSCRATPSHVETVVSDTLIGTMRIDPLVVPSYAILLAGCGLAAPSPGGSRTTDSPAPLMAPARPADTLGEPLLDVRRNAASSDRPPLAGGSRDPFRFGPADGGEPPGTAPGEAPPAVSDDAAGRMPDRPADPDGAVLRFIGLVDAPESAGRVAVVTDGAGVFHGRVDDVVAGRYRIIAIDPASIEIEPVPSGRRRTLSLHGP